MVKTPNLTGGALSLPKQRAGLKPPAQFMEALRADERVGFSRLPRTEAGL